MELIKNSEEGLFELKRIIEEQAKPERTQIQLPPQIQQQKKEIQPEEPLTKSILSEEEISVPTPASEVSVINPVSIRPQRQEISEAALRQIESPVLRIPEPKLPPEFQYLMPIPSTREIDLDKLNPLVYDPQVREIECDGPNKPIIVNGMMGRKPTEIILSGNEIDDTILRFSRAAKIPADVGVYKVVVGNLIFSAVISDVVASRFFITKMTPQPLTFRPNPMQPQTRQAVDYSSYIRK